MKMAIKILPSRNVEKSAPNVLKKDSKLNVFVHFRVRPDEKHKVPNIKVDAHNTDFAPNKSAAISIEDIPKKVEPKRKSLKSVGISADDFKELSYWIQLNKDELLEFWFDFDGKLEAETVKRGLSPLPHKWRLIPIEDAKKSKMEKK